jgi:hypothetical protein|tara:strand:+ start:614 stop:1066 length:453 start_codon:yes stop_codon:yes gene_type:complete
MAYLGKEAVNRSTGTSKDSFSGDGSTTAFTMSKSVLLVTDIEVFVDNVQQEPTTAYTVSATTLTFTEAPANGTNNVYVIHRIGNNDSMTIQSGISATLSDATISGTLTVSSGTLTVSGSGSKVNFSNLPTSDPGVAGQLYRDSGTVKVSV